MAGKNNTATYPKTQQRFVERYTDMLAQENPDQVGPGKQFASKRALTAWLLDHNPHKEWLGQICGKQEKGTLITGRVLTVPAGFEFNELRREIACEVTPAMIDMAMTRAAAPAPQAMALAAQPPVPAAEAVPLAQFEPAPDGAVRNASGLQTFLAFYGKDPKDAAADRSKENSRVRGDALNPNNSEGAKFRGVNADVEANGLPADMRGITFMGRAGKGSRGDHGELNLKPSALVVLNSETGAEQNTNRRFPFKPEQNPRYTLDENNQLRIVVDGHMTISDARRNNPFHAGFITDHTTATNLINQWNNTGRGQEVMTQWMGLQDAYSRVGGRFLNGTEPATAADAEKLLQLNVKLALHPISWSVDSRGVPAADQAVIQAAQAAVFNSERFRALPATEQSRLHEKYDALTPLMNNPVALRKAAGDISQWARPLDELIEERLVTKDTNIPSNYYDVLGREKGRHYKRDEKIEMARAGLLVMSRKADEASTQGPTEQDLRRGTGLAFSTERQSKEALQAGRSAWLGKFAEDATFRNDVSGYVANTPEALQQWTDVMFHATRATGANSSILGYKSDAAADRDVARISELLGGEKYRGKLDYHESLIGKVLNPVVQMGTIGMVSIGKGDNQRRGLDKAFTDTVAARYADTTTIEKNGFTPHDNVVEAMRQIAERAKARNDVGDERASVPLTLSLSPTLNEQRRGNNGVQDANYRQLIAAKAGPILEDQEVANAALMGNSGAQVEQGTERKAFATGNVTQVPETTASEAIKTLLETGKGTPIAGMGAPGVLTTLDPAAANAAKAAGASLSGVLATANNPGKISQGETDRETTVKLAASSPLVFSLLTLDAMAGNAGLDARAQKNLARYVQNVDNGGDGRFGFSGYADLMKHHAKAMAKAGDNADARVAAQQAAASDLNAYFAASANAPIGSKQSAMAGLAVGRLAGQMAKDNSVSAAMDIMAGGPANGPAAAGDAALAGASTAASVTAAGTGSATFHALAKPGTDVLSELVAAGAITAKDKVQLLALQANPDEAARLAGFDAWMAGHVAGENAKTARTGTSLVDLGTLLLTTVILTGKNDPLLNRGPVGECCEAPGVFPPGPTLPPIGPNTPLTPVTRLLDPVTTQITPVSAIVPPALTPAAVAPVATSAAAAAPVAAAATPVVASTPAVVATLPSTVAAAAPAVTAITAPSGLAATGGTAATLPTTIVRGVLRPGG